MPTEISGLRTDPDGLADLAPLWMELHRDHREVSLCPEPVS